MGEREGLWLYGDQCARDGERGGDFCTYVIQLPFMKGRMRRTGRGHGEDLRPVLITSKMHLQMLILAVIVRRVVAARRRHASGGAADLPSSGLLANSTSRTQPLSPLEEKVGSVEFAQRPGQTTKRGGFWARFKCW